MRCLVTGVAGFIGSHLAEALLARGHQVTGVDCFTDFYDPALKRRNIQGTLTHPAFRLVEADLLALDLPATLEGSDVVFHLAAQAGVRASWGQSFSIYTQHNILATQRLLEAVKGRPLRKFVFASSSAVYGAVERMPMGEGDPTHPISPYGVSKLAAEHLCALYWTNYRVPTLSLRYFTVFGARQRPDMAFHRLIRAVLEEKGFPLYGDGSQTRDFTHVSDVVAATIQALDCPVSGETVNIAGGARISMREAIAMVEQLTGKPARIEEHPVAQGDMAHTYADISRAQALLGYRPRTTLREGLLDEIAWLRDLPPEEGR